MKWNINKERGKKGTAGRAVFYMQSTIPFGYFPFFIHVNTWFKKEQELLLLEHFVFGSGPKVYVLDAIHRTYP